jgi:hypothetical protein
VPDLSLTEHLDEYLSVCESFGHSYRRFSPTADSKWDDACEHLGKDVSELPPELVEWYGWTDPPESALTHVPWLEGQMLPLEVPSYDFRLIWDEILGRPDDDPDGEIVEIMYAAYAVMVVSTRDVDGGSVWVRDVNEGLTARIWDSISHMVADITEFTRSPGRVELLSDTDRFEVVLPIGPGPRLPQLYLYAARLSTESS